MEVVVQLRSTKKRRHTRTKMKTSFWVIEWCESWWSILEQQKLNGGKIKWSGGTQSRHFSPKLAHSQVACRAIIEREQQAQMCYPLGGWGWEWNVKFHDSIFNIKLENVFIFMKKLFFFKKEKKCFEIEVQMMWIHLRATADGDKLCEPKL